MGYRHKVLTAALATVLAVVGVGAAYAETDYEWSIDLDCAECHAMQAASMVSASEEEGDAAAGVMDSEAADDADADAAVDDDDAGGMTGFEGYASQHAENFGFTCVTCHEDNDDLANAHKKLNSGKEAKSLRRTSISSEVCTGCHNVEDLAKKTEGVKTLVDENGTVVNPHALPAVTDHESIACADCHYAHGDESLAETAMDACASCHHARVFECHTCHK